MTKCKDIWGGSCRRTVTAPSYKCGIDHKLPVGPGALPSNREIIGIVNGDDTKASLIDKVLKSGDEELIIQIAQSPLVFEPEILYEIAQSHGYKIREALAQNPAVAVYESILLRLIHDPAFAVRKSLAANTNLAGKDHIVSQLAGDKTTGVKKTLASNQSIAYMNETLNLLAKDSDPLVAKSVAWLGDTEHLKWMVLEVSGSSAYQHEMLARILDANTPPITVGIVSLAISKTRGITHDEVIALMKRYDSPAIRATLLVVDFEVNLR